eukprot:GHVS01097462.1.p1 GENE.GHVS01097462.1~~GHVS01097462.1.p1  ORF type:complete len:428 (+),score=138.15 GHVS01097462.1:163-1446(+)
MFEARINGLFFRRLVESLSHLIDEVSIECNEQGMSFTAMDSSRVALVDVLLLQNRFSYYRCDQTTILGLSLKHLTKLLLGMSGGGGGGKDEVAGSSGGELQIEFDSDDGVLGMQMISGDTLGDEYGSTVRTRTRLLSVENQKFHGDTDRSYDCKVTMETKAFKSLVDMFKVDFELVRIRTQPAEANHGLSVDEGEEEEEVVEEEEGDTEMATQPIEEQEEEVKNEDEDEQTQRIDNDNDDHKSSNSVKEERREEAEEEGLFGQGEKEEADNSSNSKQAKKKKNKKKVGSVVCEMSVSSNSSLMELEKVYVQTTTNRLERFHLEHHKFVNESFQHRWLKDCSHLCNLLPSVRLHLRTCEPMLLWYPITDAREVEDFGHVKYFLAPRADVEGREEEEEEEEGRKRGRGGGGEGGGRQKKVRTGEGEEED